MAIILGFALVMSLGTVFNGALYFEHGVSVVLVLVMMVIIMSFVYRGFTLYHDVKYPLEIFVEDPQEGQVLEVRNIAHILCYEDNFLFTYHSGASYDLELDENLKEVYAMLHPRMFFMVNDNLVVSRRACREVWEDEDGRIRIVLEPRAKLPEHMIGKIDLEGIE